MTDTTADHYAPLRDLARDLPDETVERLAAALVEGGSINSATVLREAKADQRAAAGGHHEPGSTLRVGLTHLDRFLEWLRPTGSNGKHRDAHTPWCGCEDVTGTPEPAPLAEPQAPDLTDPTPGPLAQLDADTWAAETGAPLTELAAELDRVTTAHLAGALRHHEGALRQVLQGRALSASRDLRAYLQGAGGADLLYCTRTVRDLAHVALQVPEDHHRRPDPLALRLAAIAGALVDRLATYRGDTVTPIPTLADDERRPLP